MRKVRTISLTTIQGFNIAEKLQANGWKIIAVGFESVTLESPKK